MGARPTRRELARQRALHPRGADGGEIHAAAPLAGVSLRRPMRLAIRSRFLHGCFSVAIRARNWASGCSIIMSISRERVALWKVDRSGSTGSSARVADSFARPVGAARGWIALRRKGSQRPPAREELAVMEIEQVEIAAEKLRGIPRRFCVTLGGNGWQPLLPCCSSSVTLVSNWRRVRRRAGGQRRFRSRAVAINFVRQAVGVGSGTARSPFPYARRDEITVTKRTKRAADHRHQTGFCGNIRRVRTDLTVTTLFQLAMNENSQWSSAV